MLTTIKAIINNKCTESRLNTVPFSLFSFKNNQLPVQPVVIGMWQWKKDWSFFLKHGDRIPQKFSSNHIKQVNI